MQGKEMLNKCPQSVKDIIIKYFGSLDEFYAYVYQIGVNQHIGFKRTNQIDPSEENNLKEFLEKVGIDPFFADDLVREIICDHDQLLADNYAQTLLGPNWKKKIDAFEAMMNNFDAN